MIVVKLMGGMGNQMFQYALGKALAIKNKDTLKLDLTFLLDRTPRKDFVFRNYDLDIFKLNVDRLPDDDVRKKVRPIKNRILNRLPLITIINTVRRILNRNSFVHIKEKHFPFDPSVLTLSGNVYLDGYWQSPLYFKDIENIIRDDFTIMTELDTPAATIDREIQSTNSVCLNVRRGDFVSIQKATKFHGVMGIDYFEKAVELIKTKVQSPHLFVFSDDIGWCKENMHFDLPMTFVGNEYAGPKFSSYLKLMSHCKHFIIPNSSFAWWAAWFSENKDKVIVAPKSWFADPKVNTQDLIPKTWIRI